MGRLFGTDGVRGTANRDLTPELAVGIAVAAAHVIAETGDGGRRRLAVVGRATRASGDFLEAAVVAGLASAGVDVRRLGVLPTPGVAYLTAELDADLGVVLSASHNPMPDNGIKLIARGGTKLDDAVEDAIEAQIGTRWQRPVGRDVGRVRDVPDATNRYAAHLVATLPARVDGLRVVVDCANGAASEVAPRALRAAGADVVAIHARPDGYNINAGCGSTAMDALRQAVVEQGADAGFAFDGDADRCLAVDAGGEIVDGDQILALLAKAWLEAGRLRHGTVVATVMSNLGFLHAMEREGIAVRRTSVGDRYVLEEMRTGGYVLGGEQSGHVIMLDHATTGDGVLTALQVLGEMARTGRGLAERAAVMTKLPQVLVNVAGVDDGRVGTDPVLSAAVRAAEAELAGSGRVLLRPSGTEPLVRVMVEAPTAQQAEQLADRLAKAVESALAG